MTYYTNKFQHKCHNKFKLSYCHRTLALLNPERAPKNCGKDYYNYESICVRLS